MKTILSNPSPLSRGLRKVIVDQDSDGPGGPNMQPLLMLLQAPEVDLLGITVVSGDGWVRENTAHALRMLELVDRTDVPVIAGARDPLVHSKVRMQRWEALYGEIPYKGAWTDTWQEYDTMNRRSFEDPDALPPLEEGDPETSALAMTAAEFLVETVNAYPGEVTILALGPLTNIALAAKLDPEFGRKAKDFVFMGTGFNPPVPIKDEFTLQILHSPRHEFNTRWDPEAAYIAFRAGWPQLTIVPTDPTTNTRLSTEVMAAAVSAENPVARYMRRYHKPGFPAWDELATALWLDPSLATRTDRLALDIDIVFGPSYGGTLSWPEDQGPGLGEPVAEVVLEVDAARFCDYFVRLIRGEA